MTDLEQNPFQVLYVTDSPDPRIFVALFSAFPIRFAQQLFQPGNVILRGTQGAGKSMLLNLLKPEIRVAYHSAGEEFPLDIDARRFIGAGMNLTRSGALDIGQRPVTASAHEDEAVFPLYFGDFLNYFIVRDILRSVDLMAKQPRVFENVVNPSRLDRFASALSSEDCWFGFLEGRDRFSTLCRGVDRRIAAYRSFHQYNSSLTDDIATTKTAVGEPIGKLTDCLRSSGVIAADVPVYVRIDQLERLYRSDVLRPSLGAQYRRVINKAIGMRDSRVSYKIGTRTYAWDDDLTIFGTEDQLEHIRDFRSITLDELLRRGESKKTWIFPEFVEDTFRKRVRHVYKGLATGDDLVGRAFGTQHLVPSPSESARRYVRIGSAERVLGIDGSWPKVWIDFLTAQFERDPLQAILAAAWARQGLADGGNERLGIKPSSDNPPWGREYWRKERVRQALMQIAARSAQRLQWAGKDSILRLCGGNISICLSICHEVWDVYLRADRRKPPAERRNPLIDGIDADLQAVGIYTASAYWHSKISEQPKGDDRERFVNVLGAKFRKWLLEDAPMSYPGRNGFSLANDELGQYPAIKRFLQDAADYGDLFEAPHTTKEKDRKPRTKWYLSPILSPYFQIPEVHTKEPYYARITDVIGWLAESKVTLPGVPTGDVKHMAETSAEDDPQRRLQF